MICKFLTVNVLALTIMVCIFPKSIAYLKITNTQIKSLTTHQNEMFATNTRAFFLFKRLFNTQ